MINNKSILHKRRISSNKKLRKYSLQQGDSLFSLGISNLEYLMSCTRDILVLRNYYFKYKKTFDLDSIHLGIILTIEDRKLYLLYNFLNILNIYFEILDNFRNENKGKEINLENFKKYLNSNGFDSTSNIKLIKVCIQNHNKINNNLWHVANVNSREDIQKQLNKYLNEVAIRKISKDNPLNYENTVGFFKRLIEDYFTEISKKN